MERLQKLIAAAGIASRRHAEELITQGRVSVNGHIVTELGTKADPARDHIKVDGKPLPRREAWVYVLLHKPKGYVTTVTDPEGRPTVMDLLPQGGPRLYPVGRLDYLSEGLILLTNDGALAERLMHASTHLPKVYEVKVSGKPAEEAIERLRAGIVLPAINQPAGERGPGRRAPAVKTAPAKIRLLRDAPNPWYEVTLIEGRNRQIRRMFEQIGHHVEKIKRTAYGPLKLDVDPGQFRELKPSEVAKLKSAAQGREMRESSAFSSRLAQPKISPKSVGPSGSRGPRSTPERSRSRGRPRAGAGNRRH